MRSSNSSIIGPLTQYLQQAIMISVLACVVIEQCSPSILAFHRIEKRAKTPSKRKVSTEAGMSANLNVPPEHALDLGISPHNV